VVVPSPNERSRDAVRLDARTVDVRVVAIEPCRRQAFTCEMHIDAYRLRESRPPQIFGHWFAEVSFTVSVAGLTENEGTPWKVSKRQ